MTIGYIGVNEVLEVGLNQLLIKTSVDFELINCNIEYHHTTVDTYFIDIGSDVEFATERFAFINANLQDKKVMLYVSEHNLKNITEYLKIGAQGVMTYECEFEEILDSLKLIHKGGKSYCNKVLDILLMQQEMARKDDCLPVQLSQREIEIVQQISTGKSSKEIGEILCLSHHTINTHRKNIMKKVGVRRISELVLFAQNMGLLSS